jgi:hypothetical protein
MPRKKKVLDPATGEGEAVQKVASIAGTSGDDVAKLLKQIEGLKAQLEIETEARTEAEQATLDAVQAQGLGPLQSAVEERPTGKKIKVQKLDCYETVGYKDDGRAILRPKFKEAEVPTYWYKIDLPPVGGIGLTINGMPLYHNTVYEFDIDTLRSVKDMVHKVWKHDRDIHGSDENLYRKPQPMQMSMKTGAVSRVRE